MKHILLTTIAAVLLMGWGELQPSAPAECKHCPCGSKASCCVDSNPSDLPLPALPQRQASFHVQPVVADGQSSAAFNLPQVVLKFSSLPQPLQLKVAGVPVHKRVCRYLT